MADSALGGDTHHPPLWDGRLSGMAWGVRAIAPVAKDLKDASNRTVSILGASHELVLLWEEAVRLVSDEVVVATLDGSHGEPLHVGLTLFGRLNQGDIHPVEAVGPVEEAERLGTSRRRRAAPSLAARKAPVHRRQSCEFLRLAERAG